MFSEIKEIGKPSETQGQVGAYKKVGVSQSVSGGSNDPMTEKMPEPKLPASAASGDKMD